MNFFSISSFPISALLGSILTKVMSDIKKNSKFNILEYTTTGIIVIIGTLTLLWSFCYLNNTRSQKTTKKLKVVNEELFYDPDLEKAQSSFDYFISKDEKWLAYRYGLGGLSISWLVNLETKKKTSLPTGYLFDGFQVTADGASIIKEEHSYEDRFCDSEIEKSVRKIATNLEKEYQNVLPLEKFKGVIDSATWSKDNSKVVISESRLGESGVLWIADGDGSNAKKIAEADEIGQGPSGGIFWSGPGGYRWSDDDKSVWVFGNLKESVSSGKGAVNIYIYDIALNKLTKYNLPGPVYNFSPDQTMAVLYPGDTFGSNKIKIVNLLTKEVKTYTFMAKVLAGSWSRDSKYLSVNSINNFGLISIDKGSTYFAFEPGAGLHDDRSYKWSCKSKSVYYQTRTQVKKLNIID